MAFVFILSILASTSAASADQRRAISTLPSGSFLLMESSKQNSEAATDSTREFHSFMKMHGRDYMHGSEEYEMRKSLFEQRLEAVHAHNAKPNRLWTAGLTHFSDQTEAERKAMLGHKRTEQVQQGMSFLQIQEEETIELPESKDWTHLGAAKKVPEQGFCGSCWAFATIAVVEAHHEIYTGEYKEYSQQQVVSCAPNPHKCGGSGGCSGATVELGMDWIAKYGIATAKEVPYEAMDKKCELTAAQKPYVQNGEGVGGGALIGMTGFHTLTENSESDLAKAVVKYGPVGVAVAANPWFEYKDGVFNGCGKGGVINHAVTLFGYGTDKSKGGVKYWNIRNSYGSKWGEHGFIRLKRHDSEYCGKDDTPLEGVECPGGPSEVEVCGECGVLYNAVIPYFTKSPLPHLQGSVTPKQSGIEGKAFVEANLTAQPPAALIRVETKKHLPRIMEP